MKKAYLHYLCLPSKFYTPVTAKIHNNINMSFINQSSSILGTQPLFQYKAHLKLAIFNIERRNFAQRAKSNIYHCNSAVYSSTFITAKCCKNAIFSTAIWKYIVQHSSQQKCYIQHCDSAIYSSTFITAKCCKNAIFSTAIRQYIVQHSSPQNVSKILFCFYLWEEEFEDIKGVIIIRISKKNRQHNGQKKKQK